VDSDGCGMKSLWIIALISVAIVVAAGSTFLLLWILMAHLIDYL